MMYSSVVSAAIGSVLCGLVGPAAFAKPQSPCVQQYGQMVCGAGVQSKVDASGMVNLAQTEVTGATLVRGTFVARDAKLNDLSVSGTTNLMHVDVQGKTHLQGYLRAQETQFKQDVSVASDSVDLLDCQLSSIEVSSARKSPRLNLSGGTVVSGDVVFANEPGQVKLSDQARITGKVRNGKIIAHHSHSHKHRAKPTGENK